LIQSGKKESLQKVLVVDDEPFNVDYLEQELEDFGVATVSATNGQEALHLIEKEKPDVVLLDIMMPVMDGFEALEKMKANETTRDIPVIVISAMSDIDQIVKGIELGAEDYLPKPFDPTLLRARLTASLEKKRLRDLEKVYFQGLERELEIGRDIQAGFLPNDFPEIKGWEIAHYFEAAREVSGDFFDLFKLADGNIAIVIGDVTDKGVGAALYMALYRSLIRVYLGGDASTKNLNNTELLLETAKNTNEYICNIHDSEKFLTAFIALLDPTTAEIVYLSAGHDHPYIIDAQKEITELEPTGPAIGIMPGAEFAAKSLTLETGSTLLLYSDGITDVQNPNQEIFGPEKLLKLATMAKPSAKSLISTIVDETNAFRAGAIQFDDMTLLAISRKKAK
jgi:serine phosphatase RsbU (regulator of sigma subunit)